MRRLLVIGSMDEFVELVRHARRRGCYVIVADGYVDGPARAYADEDHVVDVRDPRKLAELYKSSRRRRYFVFRRAVRVGVRDAAYSRRRRAVSP